MQNLGLCSILTIIFVVMKLLGKIDWSWWVVLAPTLIGFVLTLLFVVAVMVTILVAAATKH